MKKSTTIKVSKETLRHLIGIIGEISTSERRRLTYDEVVHLLIKEHLQNAASHQNDNRGDKVTRTDFLKLIDNSFEGAGPEDFCECIL